MKTDKARGFWRYFFLTFKESKYLLFKYVFSAVLFLITTVLANLFDTVSLTYLNAYMSINYFANMLGFGVSDGINVLINQNIKNHKKVQSLAAIGFIWISVSSLLIVTLMAIFPEFIMGKIMGLGITDFTFYYIMLGYFFLLAVMTYLSSILKFIKAFKQSMLCDCIPYVVAIVGYLILYFTGNYVLNYLSIVYVIVGLVGVLYGILALLKNKDIKINIFIVSNFKMTWKQFNIIMANMLVEILWQVGYFAVSIFLVRVGDSYLNTYSYLENVLDIFNGFYYAFVTLTNIRIVRALGRNAFDEAYKHARYSLIGTVVIWAGYFLATVIFLYPIALGVNNAYFDIIFLVTILYILLSLVRFLDYCLLNYILRSGGKNAVAFTGYGIFTGLLIVLCFIADYLPKNLFLVYGLLIIPDLISLIIGYIYFRSRRWMSNVNQNVTVAFEQVKVFIFDFDDVLGINLSWFEADKILNDYFYEHFSYLSKDTVSKMLQQFGKVYGDKVTSKELEKILLDVEGSIVSWEEYKQTQKLLKQESKQIFVTREDIDEFRKYGAKLYLISNFKEQQLKAFFGVKGFDVSVFDEVALGTVKNKETKTQKIKHIMHKERVVAEEVFIVGDSYAEDVLVAKNLKTSYFRFDRNVKVENVFKNDKKAESK